MTFQRLLSKGEIPLLEDPRKAFDDDAVDSQLSTENKEYEDIVIDLTTATKQ